MASNAAPVTPDTLITIKVAIDGTNRRFKLPLKDLGVKVFPDKLRAILAIPTNQDAIFERFSDSSASYVVLDAENPAAYKQLYRAAKAKLKLRIKATLIDLESAKEPPNEEKQTLFPTPEPSPEAADINASSTTPAPALATESPMPKTSQIPIRSAYTSCRKINRASWWADLQQMSKEREHTLLDRRASAAPPEPLKSHAAWLVYCNNCDVAMPDAHYHCGICDDGDFDLCQSCVDSGNMCPGDGHWLVKRFVQNGQVVNSVTEKIAPKTKSQTEKTEKPEKTRVLPGAFTDDIKAAEPTPMRTCNSCVRVFPEVNLVNCSDCKDYDVCMTCHIKNDHGHNPKHTFQPVVAGSINSEYAAALLSPGRNIRHYAVCDGCDFTIYGVRHKCLNCPDWDFCSKCFKSAETIHEGHRFVPIYETLATPTAIPVRHSVYCDGPLCLGAAGPQRYIQGIRYKCAICHDTDFCAGCEAHPSNKHNPTHPLIKFKTPVKNISVTTLGEDKHGAMVTKMGDKFNWSDAVNNTRTQQRGLRPAARPSPPAYAEEKAASAKNLADYGFKSSQSEKHDAKSSEKTIETAVAGIVVESSKLDAHYVCDVVSDGTKFTPNTCFAQSWVMRNPGPHAWPAGCRVLFVGGDADIGFDPSDRTPKPFNGTQTQIEAGAEHHFTVYMRAPARPGKHISYWRLTAPDGTPFGHKLWNDIDVVEAPPMYTQTDHGVKIPIVSMNQLAKKIPSAPVAATTLIEEPVIKKEEPTDELSNSEMVFPTLEKESPSSSTYQDAPATIPAVTEIKPSSSVFPLASPMAPSTTDSLAATATEPDATDAFEQVERGDVPSDIDSVTYADDSSDETFLTDEEYDILDASDEEMLSGGAK